jgi:hypothetical protein
MPIASPKGNNIVQHEREHSPTHEWSDDGSTTVSIPCSPSHDEEDLEAMILSNPFNKKTDEDFSKFQAKATKLGSALKRDAGDHQNTPRKKLKTSK